MAIIIHFKAKKLHVPLCRVGWQNCQRNFSMVVRLKIILQLTRAVEALLMSTHNMGFLWEIRKKTQLWVLFRSTSLALLMCTNNMFSLRNKENVNFQASKSWLDMCILTIYLCLDKLKNLIIPQPRGDIKFLCPKLFPLHDHLSLQNLEINFPSFDITSN